MNEYERGHGDGVTAATLHLLGKAQKFQNIGGLTARTLASIVREIAAGVDDLPTPETPTDNVLVNQDVVDSLVMQEMFNALRYARRFMNPIEHDTAWVDAVIQKAKETGL